MRWVQGLFLVWCLVQLVCQVQGAKKKGRSGKKDWRMARCRRMMSPMQEEIKQLQETVGTISNPVHIHLHGVSDVDSSSEGDLVVKDGDDHDHERDHHHHHRDRHHKHHKHHRRGSGKSRRGGRHGNSKSSEELEVGSEDQDDSSDEDDSSEEDEGGPNQSHVHIHLKIAGGYGGKGEEGNCPTEHGGYSRNEYIFACCKVVSNEALRDSQHKVRGNVFLRQKPTGPIEVKVDVTGFSTRSDWTRQARFRNHGFHVHEFGDFSNGCNSFGGHYNPGGHAHGGPGIDHKHEGDWGNVESDHRGAITRGFNTSGFLYGPKSIFGRGIVIHEGEDDHGKAGTHSSRTTGSAGSRVGCCIVSHCNGGNW